MSTTQNKVSSLNNILSEDFFRNPDEQPLPSIHDDNLMMCKQGSTMFLNSDMLSTTNDDKHWALQDQDDEMIRQQEGGLFDLEQDYRSVEISVDIHNDDIFKQQQHQSIAYNQRQSQELPDLDCDMLGSIAAASDEFSADKQEEICNADKECDFILKTDSSSVETQEQEMMMDKSFDTTQSAANYQNDKSIVVEEEEEEHSSESSSSNRSNADDGNDNASSCTSNNQTFTFGSEILTNGQQQNSEYSSRRISVELLDDCTSEFKFDTTFSRRGRKSDDQLRKLMNIYVQNGGRMTKHMLQEAAKQSGLKRLQVYKWYWDLERKRNQTQQTQQTMYPSLIFRVTKFGRDITMPIRRPLFKVERNARPSAVNKKFRGCATNNTTTKVSPQ